LSVRQCFETFILLFTYFKSTFSVLLYCNKEEFPYWDFTLNVERINKDENNIL
jgi:hypothetical protein